MRRVNVGAFYLYIETLVIKSFGKRHMECHIWLDVVRAIKSLDATSAIVTAA